VATFRNPSKATQNARSRRIAQAGEKAARFEWFLKEVSDTVELSLLQRMKVATEYLKSKVVVNISRPVIKGKGPRGGNVVIGRSKPGEFPKAETTQLMKTIFHKVVRPPGSGFIDGIVGTPLDYGVILETRMFRSFLVRTLNEERMNITRILTGPIR